MFKKIWILLCFLFFSQIAYGEAFIVINNNDSGAGSFREALTRAAGNGNSVIDVIVFNIPGTTVAEHTIKILTDLPEINTDLVIDASLQQGVFASVNGAKIVIDGSDFDFASPYYKGVFTVAGVNSFNLYGLVVKSFLKNINGTQTAISAIVLRGVIKNVTIGDPSKGNVMYDCGGITTFSSNGFLASITNLYLMNNFIGVKENGIDIPTFASGINVTKVLNVIIGGDNVSYRNIIYGGFNMSPANYGESLTTNSKFIIKNNIFSANINEERAEVLSLGIYNMITVGTGLPHTASTQITVSDNVFGSTLTLMGFTTLNASFKRNSFGISKNLSKKLPIAGQLLLLYHLQGTIYIGGETTADGNVFANSNSNLTNQKLYPGALWAENSSEVELSHNSFFCNPEFPFLYSYVGPFGKPLEVFLDNLTTTSVSGRTKPDARVELFYSDPECTNCQPKRFFAEVTADANGNWIYNGALQAGYTVLAGATLDQVSSEFSDPRVYIMQSGPKITKVTPQTCDDPNGKIEGVFTVNVNHVEWLDEAGNVVGTALDLINVPAGKYRIKAYQFGCTVFSDWVIVDNYLPRLSFGTSPVYIHPSCNNLGSILNLYPNSPDFSWLNENGDVVGKDRELKNVPAGKYTLRLFGWSTCPKDFGPYELISSASLSANFTATKNNTLCTSNTGSINGITATGTGTISYKWTNQNNVVVGTSPDLNNVGAGIYRLEVKDESACTPLTSSTFEILEINGITMDETPVKFKESKCNANTGFIKDISVNGATSFKWVDRNGNTVSTNKDLIDFAPGDYKLIATNNTSCTKESRFFTISRSLPTVFPNYTIDKNNASCNLDNGTAALRLGNGLIPSAIKWVNEANEIVGNTYTAINLKDGLYKIFLTDENGCETLYNTINIGRTSALTVDEPKIKINNDECEQAIGSIQNIIVSGGKAPYAYSWKNEIQQQIGTSANISKLLPGNYTLSITDALNCEVKTLNFNILNRTTQLSTPIIDPITLCSPTLTNITVKNIAQEGTYRLYASLTSSSPIAEQKNGEFQVQISANSSYYISHALGKCETERTLVKIDLGNSALKIPSSFSPNGDGINDFWIIEKLKNYPKPSILIFNRNGNKIFTYTGKDLKFDGKYNGTALPAGVYYYTISLTDNCPQISGSLLIIY